MRTPGPWTALPERIDPKHGNIAGRSPMVVRETREVAKVYRSLNARIKGGRCEEAEANALLIAAAPDLLTAAKRVLDLYDMDPPRAREALAAAINKAEGKP